MTTLRKKILALSLPLSLLMGGCAIGHSEFNCAEGSEEGVCASASTIYHATNGELLEDETLTYFKDGEVKQTSLDEINKLKQQESSAKGSANAASESKSESSIEIEKAQSLVNQVKSGAQVSMLREQPVLKVWVAPWINKHNQLSMGEFIFTETHDKTWVFGRSEKDISSFQPIFKPVAKK